MLKGNSRSLALFALTLALLSGCAFAAWPTDFSNVTNFHNEQNFTAFGNATFYGKAIGAVNYAYIIPNSLQAVMSSGWLFRGYNGSVFEGNVSGYPYFNGFLVPFRTQAGKAYSTLALFSNQSVHKNTSSMSDQYMNITIDKNAFIYPFYQYLLGINKTSSHQSLSGWTTFNKNNVTFIGCAYQKNQTCTWSFRPSQQYFFTETSPYANQNISVDYINSGGVQEATLSANSIATSITAKGFPASGTLTSPLVTPFVALINGSVSNPHTAFQYGANQIFMGSNGIGWRINQTKSGLYNSSGGFAALGWLYTGTNNKATISIYAANDFSNTAFYLTPAYTSNYTNSSVMYNSTISAPPSPCSVFQYRIPVTNVTWEASFVTLANPANPGQPQTIEVPTTYLLLNFTHTQEMGAQYCNDIYLYYTSSSIQQGGEIPYRRLNCTASKVSLLVSNFTLEHLINFNSFYIYFGQPSAVPNYQVEDFSNSSIGNGYTKIFTGSGTSTPAEYSLTTAWNNVDFLNVIQGNEGIGINSGDGLGPLGSGLIGKSSGWPYIKGRYGTFLSDTLANDYNYLTDGSTLYGSGISVTGICINAPPNVCTITNTSTTTKSGSYDFIRFDTIYLTYSNKAIVTIPASTNYKLGAPQYAPNTGFNYCPNQVTNQTGQVNRTIIIPIIGNGTAIGTNGISNSSLWGNSHAMDNALSGSTAFYDITVPNWIIFLLAIVEIIFIALAFTTQNVWVVIFFLVASNFVGLTLLLGTNENSGYLIISIIAALYYVITHGHKWFR